MTTTSCAAYELQYSAAVLLCHVCGEDGGGVREGPLYCVLTASKTPLRGLVQMGVALGVDGRAGQRKRGWWCVCMRGEGSGGEGVKLGQMK